MKKFWGAEVQIQGLTSVLHEVEWSASRPGHSTPGEKNPRNLESFYSEKVTSKLPQSNEVTTRHFEH
jgi:hypothetical protein